MGGYGTKAKSFQAPVSSSDAANLSLTSALGVSFSRKTRFTTTSAINPALHDSSYPLALGLSGLKSVS